MAVAVVGQIGLGNMGGGVARHLIDNGIDVVGHDIDQDALASFEKYGGEPADSNAEVAVNADIVLTALKNTEVINDVFFGDGGIVEGATRDLICIEQSTIPPAGIRALARKLASHDIEQLLDCPFGGIPENARNGTLVLPVGGDRDLYMHDDVQSILDVMSTHRRHVGEIGAGKTTKLVNNVMSLGNFVLALEAVSMGVAQGMDAEILYNTLIDHGGASESFIKYMPQVLNREFEPRFSVDYTRKDLEFAIKAGADKNLPMPITDAILQHYTAAAAKGYGDKDFVAVAKAFEDLLEETLGASSE